jgi:hypothetical protein
MTVPQVFIPVLEQLASDAAAHFGVAQLQLRPIHYEHRPFTHLLRVAVHHEGVHESQSTLFVKVVKPRQIEGGADALRRRLICDFEATRRVHRLLSGHADLGVVPPVACYPDHLAIVTEGITGPTLLAHLQEEASWFPGTARRRALEERLSLVGRWLRVFQNSGPSAGAVTIESIRDYIDVRLERLVRHRARDFAEADRIRILEHIDRLGSQVPAADLKAVCIHADLALGNVLVSGSRIVVLDFEMANSGTSLHDVTRVFLQLELLAVKPQVREAVVTSLQRGLLNGFDPAVTPQHPLFRLLLLLHRINNVGTLSLSHRSFPENLYNRVVVSSHLRSIAAELRQPVGTRGGSSS